jgi:hypothetical protein
LGHDPSSGRDPKLLPVATRARDVTQPVATRNFFESCRIELVISFSHDFRVFSLWVTTRLGRDPKKNSGHDPRSVTTPEKSGSRPDLGRDRESGRPTRSITPNTKNDFHEDRLSFPVYEEKIKLGHFRPFLRLAVLKVQHFCRNKSSRAEKLAISLFLYGESEKIGPEMICRPPRFQLMRITLTTTLKQI